jgi:hypothetical protein
LFDLFFNVFYIFFFIIHRNQQQRLGSGLKGSFVFKRNDSSDQATNEAEIVFYDDFEKSWMKKITRNIIH